jgi:hypothetical protein
MRDSGFLRSQSSTFLERKMKTITLVAASFFVASAALAGGALAQTATPPAPAAAPAAAPASCPVQATDKKLHGAALTSFAKKCCKDQAAAQKLHGAAQTSFTKKCVTDSTTPAKT